VRRGITHGGLTAIAAIAALSDRFADRQILIMRDLDAPRNLVYKAWTRPELVKRWWGGQRGEVTIAEIDLRVGGMWRYVMVGKAGREFALHGGYREIVPNERIVSTTLCDAMPEREAVNTVMFTEVNGRTSSSFCCISRASRTATRSSARAWRSACRRGRTSWSRSRARYAEQPTGCEALHRCVVRSHSETEHLR
jgi:uncharacterized protein YndB with AHSA1/START domain